ATASPALPISALRRRWPGSTRHWLGSSGRCSARPPRLGRPIRCRARSFTGFSRQAMVGQTGAGLRTFVIPLRYGLMNALLIGFIVALISGGYWIWLAYGIAGLAVAASDELFDDDREHLGGAAAWFYEINLFATLPLLAALTVVYLHYLNK